MVVGARLRVVDVVHVELPLEPEAGAGPPGDVGADGDIPLVVAESVGVAEEEDGGGVPPPGIELPVGAADDRRLPEGERKLGARPEREPVREPVAVYGAAEGVEVVAELGGVAGEPEPIDAEFEDDLVPGIDVVTEGDPWYSVGAPLAVHLA